MPDLAASNVLVSKFLLPVLCLPVCLVFFSPEQVLFPDQR